MTTRRGAIPRLPGGVGLELIVVAVTFACIVATGAILILRTGQLTMDETVYASQARSLVGDVPFNWPIYRPPGLAVLGTVAAVAGFSEVSLRAISLLLSIVTVAMVWLVARQLWNATAALLALLAAISAPVLIRELPFFHNDLMVVGVLLLLMFLLWDQFEKRPSPTSMLLLAPLLVAAAFYLRYGSLPAILGVAVAALLLWGQRIRAHARLVGLALLLGALLLAPHVAYSMAETGSPAGIVVSAGEQANTTGPEGALRQYLRWLPRQLLGQNALVLAVVGITHGVVAGILFATGRASSGQLRRQAWVLVPALGAGAMTVLASHPEQRYALFPLVLLVISGSGALAAGISAIAHARPVGDRGSTVRLVGTVVAVLVLATSAYNANRRELRSMLRNDPPQDRAVAGARIAADADGPCRIVSSIPPILGWYSRCETFWFETPPEGLAGPPGERVPTYVVFSDIDEGRAAAADLGRYRALVDAGTLTPFPIERSERLEVYRLES